MACRTPLIPDTDADLEQAREFSRLTDLAGRVGLIANGLVCVAVLLLSCVLASVQPRRFGRVSMVASAVAFWTFPGWRARTAILVFLYAHMTVLAGLQDLVFAGSVDVCFRCVPNALEPPNSFFLRDAGVTEKFAADLEWFANTSVGQDGSLQAVRESCATVFTRTSRAARVLRAHTLPQSLGLWAEPGSRDPVVASWLADVRAVVSRTAFFPDGGLGTNGWTGSSELLGYLAGPRDPSSSVGHRLTCAGEMILQAGASDATVPTGLIVVALALKAGRRFLVHRRDSGFRAGSTVRCRKVPRTPA
jgi:hypothetical protein